MNVNMKNVIKPDIEGLVKKYKAGGIAGICMSAMGFVGFALGGFLSAAVSTGFIALALVCFFCFPLGFITAITCFTRRSYVASVCEIVEQIKQEDKMLVAKAFPVMTPLDAEMLVEKLISTGNLRGYKLVAGTLIAREELYVSEEDAKKMLQEYRASFIAQTVGVTVTPVANASEENIQPYCPSCGALITDDSAYCRYCGCKLK